MFYMLIKVADDPNNYFIKSKYPITNRQLMLNKMAVKYDIWNKEDFIGKPLTFFQYYLGILFDKMLKKILTNN